MTRNLEIEVFACSVALACTVLVLTLYKIRKAGNRSDAFEREMRKRYGGLQ